jgi:nucleotide-binding universal stress UspA family protein
MTVFTRLLVPLDGSTLAESSLPAALEVGRRLRADIVLYHALERDAPATVHGDRHLTDPDEAGRYLGGVAEWFAGQGITAAPRVDAAAGDVGARIAAAAAREQADLIVLCTHGSGGLRGLLFGRVAQQVLQRGTVPVLLVPPSAAGREQGFGCRSILVPLDGSGTAEMAVPAAAALARGFAAEMVLAIVIPTVETISGERAAAIRLMPTAASALLDAEAADGTEYLDAMVRTLAGRGLQASAAVERGEPVRALLDVAAARSADLIVIATHGRSGVGAVWAGSVAQRIIVQSPGPVLLVRIAAATP